MQEEVFELAMWCRKSGNCSYRDCSCSAVETGTNKASVEVAAPEPLRHTTGLDLYRNATLTSVQTLDQNHYPHTHFLHQKYGVMKWSSPTMV